VASPSLRRSPTAPHFKPAPDGFGRLLDPVEQQQFVGQVDVQGGRRGPVGIRGEPKRPLELRDRLPVRRQRGRRARRRGRVPQHRRDVVCFLGVKGHLRLV
jgi:hypothetical protein